MNAGAGTEGTAPGTPSPKIPESVLVVIYTRALDVLLLERADHPGFWQSVTGSRATIDEPLRATCAREVAEETGLSAPAESFDDWNLDSPVRDLRALAQPLRARRYA